MINFKSINLILSILITITISIPPQVNAEELSNKKINPQIINIPIKTGGLFNSTTNMVTELFLPAGQGPFPVLIYSHGRSGTPEARANIQEVIPRDYLRFWLSKGFAVVASMRPGYGKTGGPDRENPGHAWDNNGNCTKKPNYLNSIQMASQAPIEVITWTQKQVWANPSALIISGNSVGGITSVSVGSKNLTGVVGFINFAGGIGGNPILSPRKSCDPDQLLEMYREFGKTNKTPSLWLYAENDLFWGVDQPKAWHSAFSNGGSPSILVMTGALQRPDGHDLIFFGKDLWTSHVEEFIKKLGF
jgi:dienelactone hydrolase